MAVDPHNPMDRLNELLTSVSAYRAANQMPTLPKGAVPLEQTRWVGDLAQRAQEQAQYQNRWEQEQSTAQEQWLREQAEIERRNRALEAIERLRVPNSSGDAGFLEYLISLGKDGGTGEVPRQIPAEPLPTAHTPAGPSQLPSPLGQKWELQTPEGEPVSETKKRLPSSTIGPATGGYKPVPISTDPTFLQAFKDRARIIIDAIRPGTPSR